MSLSSKDDVNFLLHDCLKMHSQIEDSHEQSKSSSTGENFVSSSSNVTTSAGTNLNESELDTMTYWSTKELRAKWEVETLTLPGKSKPPPLFPGW